MARRSYLRRIVAPLTPGEPVLFPVPGPPPGEARPPARGGGTPPDGASEAAKPALRRTPARNIAAPAGGQVRTQAQAADPAALRTDGMPSPGPADAAPPAVPPVFGIPDRGAPPAGQPTAAEWIAPREAVPDFALATRPAEPSFMTGATLESGAPVTFQAMPAIAPAAPNKAAPASATAVVAPTPPSAPAPMPVAATRVPRAAEPIAFAKPVPRPQPQPFAPAVAGPVADQAAPPRIHIGTIEVRTAPAAPPQPAAPPPSPLSVAAAPPGATARGYGWRYGLSQG